MICYKIVAMRKLLLFIYFLYLSGAILRAQTPDPALIGYWHNWNDVNAPYIPLDQVDSRYNIVHIAFALPVAGTDYQMEFIPEQVTQATFMNQIQTLQNLGKKVIISIGGATAPITLDNVTERDTFISSMNNIINTYGFDGIDIDLEGISVTVTGGTISNPTDAKILNLIYAIQQIMSDYYTQNNTKLILTMAPETAFVQGGMSAYGSIWGAYLPVIHALRDSIDILHVQLYNSGTMYGIDNNIYTQGTADFIIALTEAVIQGFNTNGGMFAGLPASKIAVGLPACPDAAGGGYTAPVIVTGAMNYLLGNGPKPGTYTLVQTGGYPDLKGMMTWSVNWDAVNTCGTSHQFADLYQLIFGTSVSTEEDLADINYFELYPNPAKDLVSIKLTNTFHENSTFKVVNLLGQAVISGELKPEQTNKDVDVSMLKSGVYFIIIDSSNQKLIIR
jgi:chitinase